MARSAVRARVASVFICLLLQWAGLSPVLAGTAFCLVTGGMGASWFEKPDRTASESGWLESGSVIPVVLPSLASRSRKVEWLKTTEQPDGKDLGVPGGKWIPADAVVFFEEDLPPDLDPNQLRRAGLHLGKRSLPRSWIERLARRGKPTRGLVNEFAFLTGLGGITDDEDRPESLADDSEFQGIFNLITVNLDEDPTPEYLLTLGYGDPWFLVLKRQGFRFRLIHAEHLGWWDYAGRAQVQVFSTGSPNPTFHLLHLHDKGTGCYDVRHHFYKILDGRVVEVLVLPHEIRNFWGGLELHHEVRTSFFPTSPDGLEVNFRYRYYATSQSVDGQPFLDREQEVGYEWDPGQREYLPRSRGEDFSRGQLDCLGEEFLRPDRFLGAFAREADRLSKEGSFGQKRAIAALRRWRPPADEPIYGP